MKKILFLITILLIIFATPYFLPHTIKKSLLQRSLNHFPGKITIDNIEVSWFSGCQLEGVTWQDSDIKIVLPLVSIKSSVFDFLFNKRLTERVFEYSIYPFKKLEIFL